MMTWPPKWLHTRLRGVKLHGAWQAAVGTSLVIVLVIIPGAYDYVQRLKRGRKVMGEGVLNTITEQVYLKRLEIRKDLADMKGDCK